MNGNGFNPMRWDCKSGEQCYNRVLRPKIEAFHDCFPGKISFGDIDGLVEINSRALLMEWKTGRMDIPTGQHITYTNLSKTGLLVATLINGNAETMEVTNFASYIAGQFSGWREANLEFVRTAFRNWARVAKILPPVRLRPAETPEKITQYSRQELDEWVADYVSHEKEFFGVFDNLRPAA